MYLNLFYNKYDYSNGSNVDVYMVLQSDMQCTEIFHVVVSGTWKLNYLSISKVFSINYYKWKLWKFSFVIAVMEK